MRTKTFLNLQKKHNSTFLTIFFSTKGKQSYIIIKNTQPQLRMMCLLFIFFFFIRICFFLSPIISCAREKKERKKIFFSSRLKNVCVCKARRNEGIVKLSPGRAYVRRAPMQVSKQSCLRQSRTNSEFTLCSFFLLSFFLSFFPSFFLFLSFGAALFLRSSFSTFFFCRFFFHSVSVAHEISKQVESQFKYFVFK